MDAAAATAANAYSNVARLGAQLKGADDDASGAAAVSAAGGPSFMDMVGSAVKGAIGTNYASEATSIKAMAGQAELHDLVTAVTSAELTLNTMVAVRDRVINAYQDILKMPI